MRFGVGSIIRLLLEDESDISLLLLASLSTASNSRKELSRAGGKLRWVHSNQQYLDQAHFPNNLVD